VIFQSQFLFNFRSIKNVFEDFGQANCKSSSSCGTETQNEAPSKMQNKHYVIW